jgi:CspA family cold shock protein
MQTGIVKWFDPLKGHGYIQSDSSNEDIFVHISEVEEAQIPYFDKGVKVGFDIEKKADGKNAAIKLKILKKNL